MLRAWRKVTALALAIGVFLVLSLAGCGQQNQSGTSGSSGQSEQVTTKADTTKVEAPYEFSIFRATWTKLNDATDPVIQEINKRLNIKIKILTAPYESAADKINLLISSGDVPDLVVDKGPGLSNYNQWVDNGLFLDLTSLYPKYKNLNAIIPQKTLDSLKIDNKIYFLPCPVIIDDGMVFRADWLKNVNMQINNGEVTLDEFYNILKAFALNDPDKNGKNDTYGLLGEDTLTFLEFILPAFGADLPSDNGLNWIKGPDGKFMSTIFLPGYKDAIKWVNKIYKEKLLDPEWMITKSQANEDKFTSGKGGITKGSGQLLVNEENLCKKVTPTAELDIFNKIKGPDGKYGFGIYSPYWMGSSISVKAKNPEKILEFLDYTASPEGIDMLKYGLEGLTYEKKDGNVVLNNDAMIQYGYDGGGHPFRMMLAPAEFAFANDDRGKRFTDMFQWYFEAPIYEAPLGDLPSQKEVVTKQGPGMIVQELTKMIIGKTDIDTGFDKMLQKWKESGGDKLTEEINTIYEKQMSK